MIPQHLLRRRSPIEGETKRFGGASLPPGFTRRSLVLHSRIAGELANPEASQRQPFVVSGNPQQSRSQTEIFCFGRNHSDFPRALPIATRGGCIPRFSTTLPRAHGTPAAAGLV